MRPGASTFLKTTGQRACAPKIGGLHSRAMPRSFIFNRVLGVDTIKVNFNGSLVAFLNLVDHGTNLQQVVYLGRDFTAAAAWKAHQRASE